MSQKNNALHFVIHDINGQPQMIKVLQDNNNQNIEQFKIRQGPVKIIKIQKQPENPSHTAIKLSCASIIEALLNTSRTFLAAIKMVQWLGRTPYIAPHKDHELVRDFISKYSWLV